MGLGIPIHGQHCCTYSVHFVLLHCASANHRHGMSQRLQLYPPSVQLNNSKQQVAHPQTINLNEIQAAAKRHASPLPAEADGRPNTVTSEPNTVVTPQHAKTPAPTEHPPSVPSPGSLFETLPGNLQDARQSDARALLPEEYVDRFREGLPRHRPALAAAAQNYLVSRRAELDEPDNMYRSETPSRVDWPSSSTDTIGWGSKGKSSSSYRHTNKSPASLNAPPPHLASERERKIGLNREKGAALVQSVNGGASNNDLIHPLLDPEPSAYSTAPPGTPVDQDTAATRPSVMVAEGQDENTGRWNFQLRTTSQMPIQPRKTELQQSDWDANMAERDERDS